MKMRIWRMLCLTTLLFGIEHPAWAQSIKLLAPNVGWLVAAHNRVLWTTNGGRNWSNITPSVQRDHVVSAIFFLDTKHGWILFSYGAVDVPGDLHFDLAHTDDAGGTWSVQPLRIPDRISRSIFNGGASLAFSDPTHGWLSLGGGLGGASAGYGALLKTSDGGNMWETTSGNLAGPVTLITPQFGWLVGSGVNSKLFVTRDGAKTWQAVELDSPMKTDQLRTADRNVQRFQESYYKSLTAAEAAHASKWKDSAHHTYASYELPSFQDRQHGYVSVTYPGVVVLFSTDDGGITWKPERAVTGLAEHEQGKIVPSAIADSTWITGKAARHSLPHLRELGPNDHTAINQTPGPEDFGIAKMSFVARDQGWVLTSDHQLLSTDDGGATWRDITPGRRGQTASQ
jgi:photosystem II stability/assembly factor-like uncharacterized protein